MKVLSLFAAAAFVCMAAPAEAIVLDPPWCAHGGGNEQYENCGYFTWQQCMASVSGVGGMCIPNPRAPYAEERDYQPRKKKSRRYRD